jgi:hypothetical protein
MSSNHLNLTYEPIATAGIHIVDIHARTHDDTTAVGLLTLFLEQWRRNDTEYVVVATTGDNDLVWLLDTVGFEVLEAPTGDGEEYIKAWYDFADEPSAATAQRKALIDLGHDDPAALLSGTRTPSSNA